MSRYAAWRAYVFLFLSCLPLLLSGPAAIAPVRSVSPTSLSVQTAVGRNVGPRATITCPAGAVNIVPGQSIQRLVDIYPGGTTFCLRAGVWNVTSSVTPKTGDSFIGEYGAVLDGTGWVTTNPDDAAFKALNQDIDYVTIRNLVIRKMPQHGITAFYQLSDHWTIENNELASNKFGVEIPAAATVRYNYIHHNVSSTPSASSPQERGGGYLCQRCDNTIIEGNDISYNGMEQKIANHSVGVVFRNNFVHHNLGDGIWYDTNNAAAAIVDGNSVDDNGRDGISFEASIGATIRNNTLRRNADAAVFISMSQNAQIHNNSLAANFGGIKYFLNCDSLVAGEDVKNNAAYDNTVIVGTQSSAYANGFGSTSCTSGQLTPYLNGAKKLTFSHNAYGVPSLAFRRYFLWGGWKPWKEWQTLGHDRDGSLSRSP
jgi:parallel beta-helix repeat protein